MDKIITVVLLEEIEVTILSCSISNDGSIDISARDVWNPSKYLTDPNGQRLIDEISRRVRVHWKNNATSTC